MALSSKGSASVTTENDHVPKVTALMNVCIKTRDSQWEGNPVPDFSLMKMRYPTEPSPQKLIEYKNLKSGNK